MLLMVPCSMSRPATVYLCFQQGKNLETLYRSRSKHIQTSSSFHLFSPKLSLFLVSQSLSTEEGSLSINLRLPSPSVLCILDGHVPISLICHVLNILCVDYYSISPPFTDCSLVLHWYPLQFILFCFLKNYSMQSAYSLASDHHMASFVSTIKPFVWFISSFSPVTSHHYYPTSCFAPVRVNNLLCYYDLSCPFLIVFLVLGGALAYVDIK